MLTSESSFAAASAALLARCLGAPAVSSAGGGVSGFAILWWKPAPSLLALPVATSDLVQVAPLAQPSSSVLGSCFSMDTNRVSSPER